MKLWSGMKSWSRSTVALLPVLTLSMVASGIASGRTSSPYGNPYASQAGPPATAPATTAPVGTAPSTVPVQTQDAPHLPDGTGAGGTVVPRTDSVPVKSAPERPAPVRNPQTPATPKPEEPRKPGDPAPYVLGPNDVVGVSVWDDKNLTGSYAIGPDGRISMALVGEFKVTGLTIPALQNLIAEKLKEWINDPIVNVQLLRNNSKKYTLIGAVLKTGPYPLLQETTILDALAASGGFREFASKKKIVLIRGPKRFPFNYNDVMKGRNMDQNKTLEDGDIISVPGE